MERSIELISRMPSGSRNNPFTVGRAKEAFAFHRSFPAYQETPLVQLKDLAKELGVAGIYVKDESKRFEQNAFKVLGGSYCLGHCIAKKLGMSLSDLPFSRLISEEIREKLGKCTFVTATDGNHGRGIAWTVKQLGQACVVYMPKGSAQERLDHILKLGADASITDMNYDDTVRFAQEQAEKHGWILVQDTSWEGYEKIPTWIMQGYTTLAYEITRQLPKRPTHIFLQAGVGAMAGAMTAFFADFYGKNLPIITVVEPHPANCVFRTAKAMDGKLHTVGGDLSTMMAGLSCGEPCHVAWEQIRAHARHYASVPDSVAAHGMRLLADPVGQDEAVVSGESGAVTTGLIDLLLREPRYQDFRKQLGLNEHSRILCISTEGDTDRENYRRIIESDMRTAG